MFTAKGQFSWYELMTSDTKAAGKFYSDVVDWTTQEMPSSAGMEYTTFNIGNVGIAGMLNLTGHTAWIGYISVGDVDAHPHHHLLLVLALPVIFGSLDMSFYLRANDQYISGDI